MTGVEHGTFGAGFIDDDDDDDPSVVCWLFDAVISYCRHFFVVKFVSFPI